MALLDSLVIGFRRLVRRLGRRWRRVPAATPAARPAAQSESAEPTWRAIVEAVAEPVVVVDRTGVVRQCNSPSIALFGRVRPGQHISIMCRNPELLDAIETVQESREPVTVEILVLGPSLRHMTATVAWLGGASLPPPAPKLLVTFRDRTEEDRLNRMRADFVANASHELRTPLASLRGFIDTLRGPAREDREARERFLAIMAAQGERMTRLIDDLLSLSRVEMRAHLPPNSLADLAEVARNVVQSLEPVATAASITLETAGLADAAWVRGDRDELTQVVQNLVQNGIKYGRPGGHVTIRLVCERAAASQGKETARRYRLSIADDGPGISPEHLPRLTERFYRVNVTSSREKGGTGLGLAIVKHIVNRHRGDLDIDSKVGQGSTFSVVLDAVEPADAARP
ncbi:MAG: ATP-binding protein [Hyphomicrobiaceae bacterium]